MDQLKDVIREYSDDFLINQYIDHRDEYTPEALGIIEEEMKLRKINPEEIKTKPAESGKKTTVLNLDSDDFVLFEHTFTRTDLIIAISILKDNNIIFFADNPSSSDIYPVESEAFKRYTLHVHKDFLEKTHELLGEHYEKVGDEFQSKHSRPVDRLKSFNFHDIRISDQEAKELIDVGFSNDEIQVIKKYGNRLLSEIDTIEQDRVVFFYDSIEPLLDTLKDSTDGRLNRPDLLTILEILQIYCDDPDFPAEIDEAIVTLLSFFFEQ